MVRTAARVKKDKRNLVKDLPPDLFEGEGADDTARPSAPCIGNKDRLEALANVAGRFKGHKPPREVLRVVRAVPTIFPWFDWTTRVNGFPTDRISLVHGPSNHGKTIFGHGIGLSFLQRGHFYRLLDAERTTPITWLQKLWGKDFVDHPGFSACRPDTYEAAVDDVRQWATTIGEARDKGDLPADTTGVLLVDSIRKLVPQKFFDKIAKQASEDTGTDGFGGRGAQMKALLNSAWMDELVVLMEKSRCAMVFIARESSEKNPNPKGADIIHVGGGGALIYDSSLVIRVRRANWMVEGKTTTDAGTPVGERLEVAINKTKIAGKDDRVVRSFFHTTNGNVQGVPEGYARAWDLIGLGIRLGVVEQAGAWFKWPGVRCQGEPAAFRKLSANPEMMVELEAACRAKFKMEAEEEVDADGVVTNPHTGG